MAVLLVTLTTMLKLGLPHVNVLSKIDLVTVQRLPSLLPFLPGTLRNNLVCHAVYDACGINRPFQSMHD